MRFRRLPFLLLGLLAAPPPAAADDVLVAAGASWRYLDDGSDQGTAWRDPGHDDSAWMTGPAPLGYGDGDEATTVGYGPDPADKYPTTYFRHELTVADASPYRSLRLRLQRDDGAVVYLNGSEVHRSNLLSGAIGYRDLATTAVAGSDEDLFYNALLPATALRTGRNVVAVEVHQVDGNSSDISFDLALDASPAVGLLEWVWSGALTPTSIRIRARVTRDSPRVRLLVSERPDLSSPRASSAIAADLLANDRVVTATFRGLRPDTTYHYGVEVDGVIDPDRPGRFRTPRGGTMGFTIALGSCAATATVHPVFATIRAHDPLFFLHMGDFHYQDTAVDDPAPYRAAFDTVLGSPEQAALYRSAPIDYVWDDHDFGGNNSSRNSIGRAAVRQVYQERVPHYPLPAGAGDVPVYQAYSIGRVRFLHTDSRSERSPDADPDTPAKTMLGAAQKAWLFAELQAASGTYPLIVWVNSLPWIGAAGSDTDAWYSYSNERREIADFIAQSGIRGLAMVSGDAHMLAIDDGTNSDYSSGGGAAFPVFHAAALDRPGSVKGGPYSHGTFPGGGQFGLMTVEDDGSSPLCVTWSGRDASDVELVGHRFCTPTTPPIDSDGDGTVDIDDCAFADPRLRVRPGPVTDLYLVKAPGGVVRFEWAEQASAAGPATVYDIASGDVGELHADLGFRRAGCFASALAASTLDDASGPPAAAARYFLVRAASGCGSGGWGETGPFDPRLELEGDAPCPLP